MLDFLKEIVESVPDPSAGGTIDLEAENAEASKRKRGKGKKNGGVEEGGGAAAPRKRRKKKTEEEAEMKSEADDDDDDEEDDKPVASAGASGSGWKTKPGEEAWRGDAPYMPR